MKHPIDEDTFFTVFSRLNSESPEDLLAEIQKFREDQSGISYFLSKDESETLNKNEQDFLFSMAYMIHKAVIESGEYEFKRVRIAEMNAIMESYYAQLEKSKSDNFIIDFVKSHPQSDIAALILESIQSSEEIREDYNLDMLFALCAVTKALTSTS